MKNSPQGQGFRVTATAEFESFSDDKSLSAVVYMYLCQY